MGENWLVKITGSKKVQKQLETAQKQIKTAPNSSNTPQNSSKSPKNSQFKNLSNNPKNQVEYQLDISKFDSGVYEPDTTRKLTQLKNQSTFFSADIHS